MECENFECKSLLENAKELKILHVRDEKSEDGLIIDVFYSAFKKVCTTQSVNEALDMFKSNFYDIIMVDTHIGNDSGIELISKIKSIANKKSVVAIGVDKCSNDLITLINIGIEGYIILPTSENELIKILNRICLNVTEYNMLTQFSTLLEKSYDEISQQKNKLNQLLIEKIGSDAMSITEQLHVVNVPKKEVVKISAKDFVAKLPNYLVNTIEELSDNIADIEEKLNILVASPTLLNAQKTSLSFTDFTTNLEQFEEFSDLALAIQKIVHIFEHINLNRDFNIYFEIFGVISDEFRNWFDSIFLASSLQDIHELDESIIANCMMIESIFGQNSTTHVNNEAIEFF